MGGDENGSPAVGDEQPHPEPVLPGAQGSSTEPSPNGHRLVEYYHARRQFRYGRFLAPMSFPAPDDDAWMRFIDDELVADGVYRNGRFGAILALELEEEATVGEGDETSSWEGSMTDGDDDPEPVMEVDRLLRMRLVHFHHLSAPTRFPPEHDASYTRAMEDILRLRESNFIFLFGNGQPAPDPDDGAAYRNGGFGAVPASQEAMAALPETTLGEGEDEARGKECAVCLEVYEAGDTLRTMPCSHGFHERCIFQWLRVSCLCPLCRFALPVATAEETESFSFVHGRGGDGEEEPSAWIHYQMHSS